MGLFLGYSMSADSNVPGRSGFAVAAVLSLLGLIRLEASLNSLRACP